MPDPSDTPFVSSVAHSAADPFRLLVESVVDCAIFMLDPAGNVASWNPAAERIYGYTAIEIIGESSARLYPPDEAASGVPLAARRRALEEGSFAENSARVRKDGSHFCAEVTTSNLKDYCGNHAGFSVVTRDVTEREATTAAIGRERDISAAILRSLPGIYYMYDEQRRFVRWNKRFEEVTGYTADEIRDLHPLDLFASPDRETVAERIEIVFRDGKDQVEARLISKSGQRTPYYFTGVRAEVDGQRCLLGVGIDISGYKRAEHELQAADERLRQAARAAEVGLWDLDLRTNEVFYSPEWKRQLGYEEHELGHDLDVWQLRVHPDDVDLALQRMEAFVADPGKEYQAEFRLRHRDGSYRRILSQASLLFDENNVATHMLGSHVDVTEQRQIEMQLLHAQKMEAVGQLAAGVAHDFNNLLTVINGYSDLLLNQVHADDPMRALLTEIHEAGQRARTLTRQLLAFSRQQVLEPKVLNLNEVVTNTERMLRRLIGEDIVLTTALSPEIGPVQADPGQVEQVLVNLTVNARDAMPAGGRLTIETGNVTLDENYCRAFPDLAPGSYVVLSVRDNGTGMDEATQSHMFEPFFTTKGVGHGTGLGLATVHGIVKQSRGHVAVFSEPGHGTTLNVYLPEVAEPLSTLPTEDAIGALVRGTETVLVVEDEESVRALERHILEHSGYQVLLAANGREALDVARVHQGEIALLISDVVMPQLGGRELANQFKLLRPGAKVLFLSGYADDAVLRHGALDAEFAFLQKPFTPAQLAQTARRVLDGPR